MLDIIIKVLFIFLVLLLIFFTIRQNYYERRLQVAKDVKARFETWEILQGEDDEVIADYIIGKNKELRTLYENHKRKVEE